MADARVIPMDARARRGGAGAVLAGADRATGERERRRRRTTPLLAGREAAADETPEAGERKASARRTAAKKAPAAERATAAEKTTAAKKTPAKKTTKKTPGAKKAATATRAPAARKSAAKKPAPAGKPAAKRTSSAASGVATVDENVEETLPAEPRPSVAGDVELAPEPEEDPQGTGLESLDEGIPVDPDRDHDDSGDDAGAEPPAVPAERPTPDWVLEARARAAARATVADEPPAGGRFSLAAGIASQAGEMLLDAVGAGRRAADVQGGVGSVLEYVSRRLAGEYDVDEFGFDPEFTDTVWLNLLRPIYRKWFRVEVRGIENIPSEGGALIVANHSGTLPMDALMTSVAVHDEHPEHRFLRTLGADLVFETPFLAGLARKAGATLATNPDAERLLSEGNVVGVWPEGFKGIGKPFTERYKLQRFGRGGFVSAALRTRTPIVPCSIVGAEEIFPIVADVPALARLLGLPYLPITPFFPLLGPLGAIPLPSKWLIEFGQPVPTDEYGPAAAEDPMLVFDLTDRVRQTIQQTLYSLLVQRRSIFF